ncbi:MAG: c-type cytochrome [Opitutaceae bacterium]
MTIRFCIVAAVCAPGLSPLPAAERAAQENYKQHCVECHGRDGKSQTRLGRKAGAKDLSDKENQAKLTDEDAFNGIKNGRKNSKGEEKMEAFGHLMSDKEIQDLVAYIRTFAK